MTAAWPRNQIQRTNHAIGSDVANQAEILQGDALVAASIVRVVPLHEIERVIDAS